MIADTLAENIQSDQVILSLSGNKKKKVFRGEVDSFFT